MKTPEELRAIRRAAGLKRAAMGGMAEAGRKGGRATTIAKAITAKQNARKVRPGGRPRGGSVKGWKYKRNRPLTPEEPQT